MLTHEKQGIFALVILSLITISIFLILFLHITEILKC